MEHLVMDGIDHVNGCFSHTLSWDALLCIEGLQKWPSHALPNKDDSIPCQCVVGLLLELFVQMLEAPMLTLHLQSRLTLGRQMLFNCIGQLLCQVVLLGVKRECNLRAYILRKSTIN